MVLHLAGVEFIVLPARPGMPDAIKVGNNR